MKTIEYAMRDAATFNHYDISQRSVILSDETRSAWWYAFKYNWPHVKMLEWGFTA